MALSLVSTTTGTWTDSVGPQSLSAIGNTAGNMLVASVSIIASSLTPQSTQIVPATSICDSVGNWWRLAADTGGSNGQVMRVAMWICDNALAIPANGWLSIASAGYTQVIDIIVAEYTGLPAGYEPVIDFAVTYAQNATSTVVLTGVTSQSDYCFASARSHNVTLTPPSSPFTLATLVGQLNASYATISGAGTSVTGSFGLASAQQGAGVMVGISTASYPPSNGNPNFPVVKLESAFGATPGDSTQAILDTAWTDITQRAITDNGVAGITVSRGRQYELATPEAGELTVLLNNVDGAFDPTWPGSPYYSNALNANMSFQSGVSPWTPINNATLSRSSAYAYASGQNAVSAYSMLVAPDGVTANTGASSENVPVNVNYAYSFSCWANCPVGYASGVYVQVNWYNSSLSYLGQTIGSSVPLTAGVWTLVSLTNVTPTTGAAYARLYFVAASTPSSSDVFYVAELAMVQGGNIVNTGLVRLQTPIRISASWQGHRYPLGFGYVERWPQSWPQMPQWGFSPMIATDVVGIANAVNLPSAVQGEILADQPYVCLPFNEQYQTSSNTINGAVATASDASGLIAVNTSRVNQQAANYITGDQPVETGQTITLNGDSGTGMGVSSYSALTTTNLRGSGAVYGPDTSLPVIGQSTGALFDFWVTVPSVANTSGSQQFVPLIQLFGKPYMDSIGTAHLAPGWLMTAGVYFPVSGTTTSIYVEYSEGTAIVVAVQPFPLDATCYVVLDIQPSGSISCILNSSISTGAVSMLTGPLEAITFGQASYAYGNASARTNYSLAYGSVYSYEVPAFRYASHYAAGITGFAGDTIMQRFGRYQAWAQLNVNGAGPGAIADAFQLSAAYSTDGSSLASALNSDVQSAGAMWFGNANGNLVVIPRPATYRQPSTVTFGDNAMSVLNANPDFSQNGLSWAASSGTITIVTAQPAGSLYPYAALFTLTGSAGGIAEVGAPFSASANNEYTIGAWTYTTQTAITLSFTWLNSVGSTISVSTTTVVVQTSTWTYVMFTATAPATTVSGYPFTGITGSAGDIIYIEHAIVTGTTGEIPYEKNISLDYDNTYIQNVTQATLVQGGNSLVAPIEKNLPSINAYLTRGPQGISVAGSSSQDAYDVSYWYLNKYSQPQLRVSQVTVDSATNPLGFATVLQTDISDVATVNRRPLGAPSYNLPVITQRVETEIGPGIWTTAYQLSPYVQEADVLVADISGQDVLGSSTLAW